MRNGNSPGARARVWRLSLVGKGESLEEGILMETKFDSVKC